MKISAYLLIFLIALLTLTGCATYPISREIREAANKDLSFYMVKSEPENYTGETVIWGGHIIETIITDTGSELIILQTPLETTQRPQQPGLSMGRFIGKTKNFLDPEIYSKGKRVTVAGVLANPETRPLSNTKYEYPVIDIKELYLWPREILYDPIHPWDYGPYWWDPGWYGRVGYYGQFR